MVFDNNFEIPSYLDNDFFKISLEDGLRDKHIEIKQIVFAEPNGGGENYCSNIYRVKILYKSSKYQFDKEIKLIIKSIAITPATQFLEELAVFFREKIFYFDVLGKLELLTANGTKFGAKCLYATREPTQTFIFDDLTQYGYKLANRQNGLNEEHCVVTLRKLAKFHSSSIILLKRDPNVKENFRSGMLDENYVRTNKRFTDFMTLLLRTLVDIAKTWDGYEIISEKLDKHCDNLIENLVKTGKAIPGEITVLNHGDLWVNNFLFKYAEDKPEKPVDVLFVSHISSEKTRRICATIIY